MIWGSRYSPIAVSRAEWPVGPVTREPLADRDAVLLGELLLDQRGAGAQALELVVGAVEPAEAVDVAQGERLDAVDHVCEVADGAAVDLDLVDVLRRGRGHGRQVLDAVACRARDRRVGVAGHHQVDGVALDRAGQRVLEARRKDGDEHHQAQPHHQRRRRDRGARRVAGRVLARELAGRVPGAFERPADDGGERPHDVAGHRATPMNTSSDPAPIAVGAAAAPPPSRPCSSRAIPSAPTSPTAAWRRRLGGVASAPASSRNAATGATRVARTAGTSAASSVTPMPTPSPIAMVRGASSMAPRGMPIPAASNSAPSRRLEPRPVSSPATDARTPRSSASAATPARTWPRVAPSERSRANSRRRCATVIENVLKMMNAPTSSAAQEREQRRLEERPDAVVDLLRRLGGRLRAGLDLDPRRKARAQIAHERFGVTSAADATIPETLPSRRFQACTSASGATIIVAPPIEATLPKSAMPTRRTGRIRCAWSRPRGRRPPGARPRRACG